MSRNYEDEQKTLKEEMEILREEIEQQEQQTQNLELFIQMVKEHLGMAVLTPYAAHELIRAIYIGAPDKSSGKRRQSIQICYDLVGSIPLVELMKQERALCNTPNFGSTFFAAAAANAARRFDNPARCVYNVLIP